MSTGRFTAAPPALLGVEVGRRRVRLALLDPEGRVVHDAAEVPIDEPEDHVEALAAATSRAIAAGIHELGITAATSVQVGATIGFPHCGVGSGPALAGWLTELSRELGEPVVFIGEHGISYAPVHCLDYVDHVFRYVPLRLDRVELAPVAAGRTLGLLRTGLVTLGSGIGWTARILDGEMMEAFEAGGGPVDEALHVIANDEARPVQLLDGVFIDESLSLERRLSPGSLAPAVGVALALLDPPARHDLLDGRLVDASDRRAGTSRPNPAPRPHPLTPRPDIDPDITGPRPPVSSPDPVPRQGPDPRPSGGLRSVARPEDTRRTTPAAPGTGRSTEDILIGALLMLTLLLLVALVLP